MSVVLTRVYDDVTPNNPDTSRKGNRDASWSRSRKGVKAGKRAPVMVYYPSETGALQLVGMYRNGKPVTVAPKG